MPDQLTSSDSPVLLVGAGSMAQEYARVLAHLGRPISCMGRGRESAESFQAATGVTPSTGDLTSQIEAAGDLPQEAIVAVNAMALSEVTSQLAHAGVRRLLVEKPGALDRAEIDALARAHDVTGAEIRIGFNRRFLESVRRVRSIIAEDGGVLSVKFDFSEPSRRIAGLEKPQRELDTWFFGNSLHVVDLAVHLAGEIEAVSATTAGAVSWHPSAGVFAGHATASSGALLSWHANWIGPGRWGVEVVTPERRLILQPLEQLRFADHSSFKEFSVDLAADADEFKPGLRRQVEAFLNGDDDAVLSDLAEQRRRWPVYEAIRAGRTYAAGGSGLGVTA